MAGITKTAADADSSGAFDLCTVTAVYPDRYVLEARSTYTQKTYTDIPYGAAYTHPDHSGGIYFCPEPGAKCYVFTSGDETSFVGAWVVDPLPPPANENTNSTDDGPDYTRSRVQLEPGDIFLGTKDGNSILVRKGGIVQIGSGPLAQRIYVPISNLVRDFCERYEMLSPLGRVHWNRTEHVGDTSHVVIGYDYKASATSELQQGKYAVEVRYGELSDESLDVTNDEDHLFGNASKDKATIGTKIGRLSCIVYSADGGTLTYAFQISKEGDVVHIIKGDCYIDVEKKTTVNLMKDLTVALGGKLEVIRWTQTISLLELMCKNVIFNGLQTLILKAPVLTLDSSGTKITLTSAGITISGGTVQFGAGGSAAVLVDRNLLQSLADHVHTIPPIPSVPTAQLTTGKSLQLALSSISQNKSSFIKGS